MSSGKLKSMTHCSQDYFFYQLLRILLIIWLSHLVEHLAGNWDGVEKKGFRQNKKQKMCLMQNSNQGLTACKSVLCHLITVLQTTTLIPLLRVRHVIH